MSQLVPIEANAPIADPPRAANAETYTVSIVYNAVNMDCILTPNCIWRIVRNARSMGVTSANTSWCRLDIADQTVDEAAETRKEHEKVVAV